MRVGYFFVLSSHMMTCKYPAIFDKGHEHQRTVVSDES
jgi:hypothetical protein